MTQREVDLIESARIRSELLAERFARTQAGLRAAHTSLLGALNRLSEVEAGAADKVGAHHEELAAERHGAREALDEVRERIDEAHSLAARTAASVARTEAAAAMAEAVSDARAKIEAARPSVVAAASSIEDTQRSLEAAQSEANAALDDFVTSMTEDAGAASEAAESFVAAMRGASGALSESVDAAAKTTAGQRSEFSAFVAQLVSSSVRSPADALVALTREHVEAQIRAKARDAAHAVREALSKAVETLRSHGSDVATRTSDARARFQQMNDSSTRASGKAERVLAEEERVRREQEEGGGGGEPNV